MIHCNALILENKTKLNIHIGIKTSCQWRWMFHFIKWIIEFISKPNNSAIHLSSYSMENLIFFKIQSICPFQSSMSEKTPKSRSSIHQRLKSCWERLSWKLFPTKVFILELASQEAALKLRSQFEKWWKTPAKKIFKRPFLFKLIYFNKFSSQNSKKIKMEIRVGL